jgi:hypothetical protein
LQAGLEELQEWREALDPALAAIEKDAQDNAQAIQVWCLALGFFNSEEETIFRFVMRI